MKKMMIVAISMMAALAGCARVDTGNVGVERSFGQMKLEELPPGVYLTVFKDVIEINGREAAIGMQDLKPKAKENLTMQDFDFDVYYKVSPAMPADLLIKYSGDLSPRKDDDSADVGRNLVYRHAREAAYKAVTKYEFATMQNKRDELAGEIERSLQAELDAKVGKGAFLVTNVIIRNITTDRALEASIRDAAQVEFDTRKKMAQLKFAEAEAARLVVEAKGQADANKIISDSLTPTLVRLKEIEMMSRFSANKEAVIMLGGGAQPLVNIK